MEQAFIYVLKVNGLLIFFWTFYKLILQKETFYNLNRFYFLTAIVISFIIPLLFITRIEEVVISGPSLQTDLNEVLNIKTQSELSWYEKVNWLLVSFILISIISLYKITQNVWKIINLTAKIKRLEKHPTDENIKISEENDTVFSFHKWIILPHNLLDKTTCDILIQHEKIHVAQKHSFDLVLMSFLNDCFWFNPIISLIRKDVNLNLEYIVDAAMTENEHSYLYQKTLINFNQNKEQHLLTNAFNSSDLKKRILMLNTKKSNPMKKLKIALATPALLVFFGLFQVKTIAQVKTNEVTDVIFTESVSKNVYETVDIDYHETKKEKKKIQKELKKAAAEIEKAKKEIEEASNQGAITSLEIERANAEIEEAIEEGKRAILEIEEANKEIEKAKLEIQKANREKANAEREKANIKREKAAIKKAKLELRNSKN